MAHKIDNSKGFNAFISFQEPAWHGLGKIFKDDISTLQALEEAGLNYTVLKLPNVHCLPNGTEVISENSFFTCRTDTNAILGDKFGRIYEVLQNVEALNVVDEILQSGRATIETAGAIDGGKKAFICLKVDKNITVGSSDVIKQYVLIANSHDGSLAITATPTNVRVVCNNTLTAALNGATGAVKIRHTSNAGDRLREAAKVLNLIQHNTEINTDNYNRMKEIEISKADLMNYFGNVFLNADDFKKLQSGGKFQDVISKQKQNQLLEVANFATRGIGQADALNGTTPNMWYAYNAVTGYMTRKKYGSADDRANSMLFGSAAQTIQHAGVLALEPAKIQPLHKTNNLTGLNLN